VVGVSATSPRTSARTGEHRGPRRDLRTEKLARHRPLRPRTHAHAGFG
jgi:hypothetical protein